MATQEIIAYLQHLAKAADRAEDLARPLCEVIVADNRRGALAQLDWQGKRMPDVTCRGGKDASLSKHARIARSVLRDVPNLGHYLGPKFDTGHVVLDAAPGNGNLTSAQYRKCTGPALAPRGARSRVIANLITPFVDRMVDGSWRFGMAWVNILSKKGVPFLKSHFDGENGLPVRDLRGIRPEGMAEANRIVQDWIRNLLETS